MRSGHGEPLQRLIDERDRLERLLEVDAAWRAFRDLDLHPAARVAGAKTGAAAEGDSEALRARLEAQLQSNRIYLARRKIIEAIALLEDPVDAAPPDDPADDPADDPPDDLTRIRGIDRALARSLAGSGVTTFAAIAGWTAADVRRITAALSLGRRIARENWIEQAALLAPPPSPAPPPEPPASIEPPSAPPPVSAPASTPSPAPAPAPALDVAPLVADAARRILARAAATPAPEPVAPPAPDDLSLIGGLDATDRARLSALGVTRFDTLAALSPALVSNLRADAAERPRSQQGIGQWIEQAAVLAAGGTTHHARAVAAHAGLPLAPSPDPVATAPDAALAAHFRLLAVRPPAAAVNPPPALPAPLALTVVVLPPAPLPQQPATASATAAGGLAELGSFFDTFEIDLSEAAVEIVTPPSSAAPILEPASRPFLPRSGPGTLESRLRRAGHDDGLDGSAYAAYRSAVVEASVEIVHHGRPTPPQRASIATADAGSGPWPADRGAGSVRRFLRSLTGQSR